MTITTTSFFHTDVWPTRKTHLSRCQMLPFEKRICYFSVTFYTGGWYDVFWKTTYRSQISIYFGVCSIIFTWKRTGITKSCCSHVQGREITQIFVELLHDFQHQMSQTCQEVKLFLKRIVKFSIQNTRYFSPCAPSVLWRMQVLLWCLKFSKLPLSVKQKYILLIKHTTLERALGGT